MIVTRFAPSPTGLLHLGHAYSAILAYQFAVERKGRFVLRIEDIDQNRCRPEFTEAIYEDLSWLGLSWASPVYIQSEHFENYTYSLDELKKSGLIYPCFCTRKDIQAEINRSDHAPHGPDGPIYPGLCRAQPEHERKNLLDSQKPHAWRLDAAKAVQYLKELGRWPLFWEDLQTGTSAVSLKNFGDIVLARKDTPTSYHLSVTIDDALQGITHVIRGKDLYHASHIHRVLQALLDLPTPLYLHHRLVTDANGIRFAKRHHAETLQDLRKKGVNPAEIYTRLGITPR